MTETDKKKIEKLQMEGMGYLAVCSLHCLYLNAMLVVRTAVHL